MTAAKKSEQMLNERHDRYPKKYFDITQIFTHHNLQYASSGVWHFLTVW